MKQVEIKKIKICKFASEETTCFEAEVWIDGKRSGFVHNDGRGGNNSYTPPQLGFEVSEIAKSTMPKQRLSSQDKVVERDAGEEDLIAKVIAEHQDKKDLMRSLKSKMLYLKTNQETQGQSLYCVPLKQVGGDLERAISLALQRGWIASRDAVLNLMPIDSAVKAYQAAA
jgi:hypothetical protein